VRERAYDIDIMDYSQHGLGLVITHKDFDLLQRIHKGDRLTDILLFAKSALIKVNGTVRHITRIKEGKYDGCYLMGIESPEIIRGLQQDERGPHGGNQVHSS